MGKRSMWVGGGEDRKEKKGLRRPQEWGVRGAACRGQSWERRQKDGFFSNVKPMMRSLASIFLKMVFLGHCLSQGQPQPLPWVPPQPGLWPWA